MPTRSSTTVLIAQLVMGLTLVVCATVLLALDDVSTGAAFGLYAVAVTLVGGNAPLLAAFLHSGIGVASIPETHLQVLTAAATQSSVTATATSPTQTETLVESAPDSRRA